MPGTGQTTIRRLGPGDGDVIGRLASREPRTELLADDRTLFLAAFQGDEPVGFAFGYELPRRHGDPAILFLYEVSVDEAHRRQGIASALLNDLLRLAESRGIREAFVLTDPGNEAANALYAALGGAPSSAVMWEFAVTRPS